MPRTATNPRTPWAGQTKGRTRRAPSNVAASHWCPSCSELLEAGRCDTCGYGHGGDLEVDAFDAPAGDDD